MRSKFLQQVDAQVASLPQTVTMSGGAQTVKSPLLGVSHVDDNLTLGVIRSALVQFMASVTSSASMTVTPTIYHSDDTTDGNFTLVTLKTGQTLPVLTITGAASGMKEFFLDLSSLKKYVRVLFTFAGGSSDTVQFSAVFVLGDGSVESLPRSSTYVAPTVYRKA